MTRCSRYCTHWWQRPQTLSARARSLPPPCRASTPAHRSWRRISTVVTATVATPRTLLCRRTVLSYADDVAPDPPNLRSAPGAPKPPVVEHGPQMRRPIKDLGLPGKTITNVSPRIHPHPPPFRGCRWVSFQKAAPRHRIVDSSLRALPTQLSGYSARSTGSFVVSSSPRAATDTGSSGVVVFKDAVQPSSERRSRIRSAPYGCSLNLLVSRPA